MEIKINTLTPLWTGGVDAGKCDRVHETGILGSLRWWMEVLVRGLGGQVSDPTSATLRGLDPKKFDVKAYRQLQDEVERRLYLRNAGLCDVSQIFGATGWKRRFRLEIQENQICDASIQHQIKANRSYTDKQGNQKTPTWYFQNPPKSGSFSIQIQSLHPDFKPEVIGGLIQFIADWSALGARPQMGFGVIEIEERMDIQPLYEWLIKIPGSEPPRDFKNMPSLQNIFLAQIQPKNANYSFSEQDTFNLKYDLRQLFRTEEDIERNENKDGKPRPKKKDDQDKKSAQTDLRHFVMGEAPDKREVGNDAEQHRGMAAKIKISRPYENNKLMRVWGWIPEEADVYKNGWNREKIVDDIYQHLTANYTLHDWREMNSDRDTKAKNTSDAKIFLHSLLKLQEDG
jgi:CRISPR-associated protein Cmr1